MEQRNSGINNNDLVDRISDLPDSILCLILSFLHTKEVVATSILSKRWKFVWVKVHNLDFYYNRCRKDRNDGEDMKFVEFVNRVLLLHDSGILDKFCLVWKPWCISSHADSWINTAIRKNVHELSVCLMSPVGKYDIPTSVFSCDSLQSLELIGNITFISDAILICLPRLENLKLDPVYFRSEKACEKLINGCPKLNYLHLYLSYKDVYDDDYFTCIVSSASLRRLEICFVHKSVLKLNASSLEYLEVSGDISEIFVEKSSSSLVQAKFHIMLDEHELSNNSVIETIHALDCPSVTLCISERQRYWID